MGSSQVVITCSMDYLIRTWEVGSYRKLQVHVHFFT